MFIHLGGDIVVRSADVIAILDYHANSSKITRQFIKHAEKEGRVMASSNEESKSYVITKDKVYCSPISSLTLKRRANFVSSLESR
ncbi:extracellular matrix regulator RemB [Aneurinibacillus terranovensis]|uniref:extracellular matrix regulator RemB n=1 Tax=Aneurinibacillus terranovensis TaxID=278991 RepID=UPI0004269517|nr:extracellular matrix/biofilm biosynthesis regulator RemA family protein [Aneurinibacillus terranovensis]